MHKIVFFSPEISQVSANNFIQFLTEQITAGTKKLTIGVNCPGGNVTAGIAIYNTMLGMPYEIVTHNMGNVDSIANAMFLGGAVRYAAPTSTFMFHGVGFNIQNQRLEEKHLREYLDSIVADNKRIAALIASRTTISPDAANELFHEQRTRDAIWAKDNGLINDIREFIIPAGSSVQLIS